MKHCGRTSIIFSVKSITDICESIRLNTSVQLVPDNVTVELFYCDKKN